MIFRSKPTTRIFVLLIGMAVLWTAGTAFTNQNDNEKVKEIIRKMEDKMKGNTSVATIKISIVRPTWNRIMTLKTWTKGTEYSISLVTSPVKDKGTVFLKRGKEVWNWLPNVERTIKLPPSMMGQSWMGTDLTNDDLVQQSSLEDDFDHTMLPSETIDGRDCYVIESIPHPDAPVVWGKIKSWVDKKDYIQLKAEFYDEDLELVNTFAGSDIKEMNGKTIATRFAIIPADKPGHKTYMEYVDIKWDTSIENNFFTVQNMKKVRE